MASPNFTGVTADYQLYIRMYATGVGGVTVGTTQRFVVASSSRTLAGGDRVGVYYGRVVEVATIRNDVGDDPFPKVIIPDFRFSVGRSDANRTEVDALVTWCVTYADPKYERKVYVYLCNGTIDHSDDLVFFGNLRSDGVTLRGDSIEFRAKGKLDTYNIDVPTDTFEEYVDGWATAYPGQDIPDSIKSDSPRILYGDWTDAPSKWHVRAPVIRLPNGTSNVLAVLCKPNQYGIHDFGSRCSWYDSSGESLSNKTTLVSRSLTKGTFELDDTEDVDEDGDGTVLAPYYPQGNEDSDGDLIENPAWIIYDLLTEYAGVSAATEIDGDSFTATAALVSDLQFRRYVTDYEKIYDLIAEVCRDAGLVLYEKSGAFHLEQNKVYSWLGDETTTLSLNGMRVQESQAVTLRPEKWDYTRVRLSYKHNPNTDKFEKTLTEGDDDGKTLHIESKWIWSDYDAIDALAVIYDVVCGSLPTVIEATIPLRLDPSIGWLVAWDGDGFTNELFVLNRCNRNFQEATTQIQGINVGTPWYYGAWTEDADPDFDAATDDEKEEQGFWTEDTEDEVWDYTRWKG